MCVASCSRGGGEKFAPSGQVLLRRSPETALLLQLVRGGLTQGRRSGTIKSGHRRRRRLSRGATHCTHCAATGPCRQC